MAKNLMELQVDLTGELAIAVNAARIAGQFLASRRPTVDHAAGRDIKLVEDREAEALILAQIRKSSNLPILTEEAGWVGTPPNGGGAYWAVDPIDGSFNYVNSIPLCCVSIGFARVRKVSPAASMISSAMNFSRAQWDRTSASTERSAPPRKGLNEKSSRLASRLAEHKPHRIWSWRLASGARLACWAAPHFRAA